MRRSTTAPRHGEGEASGSSAAVDRLSALPDGVLHHVMSFLKAWEVVRTCVLSRRWQNLWASAPCVDIRVWYFRPESEPPEELRDFVNGLFLFREVSAPVDTLRLQSCDKDGLFDNDDANGWIRAAIKRNARLIHLSGHRRDIGVLEHMALVSNHLKILKLSYVILNDKVLRQISSSGYKSLEELDLKDCILAGSEICSASLKTLNMVRCHFNVVFSITAPNLVVLNLIIPYIRVPSFNNLGSVTTACIKLDDLFLGGDYQYITDEDCETTDDEVDIDNYKNDEKEYGLGFLQKRYGYKNDFGYGSDIESDDDTYEYSEIANDYDQLYGCNGDGHNSSKDGICQNYAERYGPNDPNTFGGHNVLHSLSNVRSLELLVYAGEVVLIRELKRCPVFSNLTTLSLGEWCMDVEFDGLVFLLQHSPNLEKLFLEPKLNSQIRKALECGIRPKGRSFTCKHIQMVKIRCSKDDVRAHMLAHLLMANAIPLEKIFVRRTGSSYLREKKFMRDLGKQQLRFWGLDSWH